MADVSQILLNSLWNEALDAAIRTIRDEVYHEAQDTDFDTGFNLAKEIAIIKLTRYKK